MASIGVSISGIIWTCSSWSRFTCEFPIPVPVYLLGFFGLMTFTWIAFHQMNRLNYVAFNIIRAVFILIATFWAVLGTLLYTNLVLDDSCVRYKQTHDGYTKYIILSAFIISYLISYVLRKVQPGPGPRVYRRGQRLLSTTRNLPIELNKVNEWSTRIDDIEEEVVCVICLDNMMVNSM